jgi:hypothetical protein
MAERTTTLLAEILRAEPEFYKLANVVPEYEFPPKRVFEGRYKERGAYASD